MPRRGETRQERSVDRINQGIERKYPALWYHLDIRSLQACTLPLSYYSYLHLFCRAQQGQGPLGKALYTLNLHLTQRIAGVGEVINFLSQDQGIAMVPERSLTYHKLKSLWSSMTKGWRLTTAAGTSQLKRIWVNSLKVAELKREFINSFEHVCTLDWFPSSYKLAFDWQA